MNILKRIKRYLTVKFSFSKDPRERIISFWEKGGPDFEYFEKADQEDWIKGFWNNQSTFYQLFQYLDLHTTLEIACGTGRHSARVIDKIKKLYLLDSSQGAINKAKERFTDYTNIVYIHSKDGIGYLLSFPMAHLLRSSPMMRWFILKKRRSLVMWKTASGS